jgi:hypothetical protein
MRETPYIVAAYSVAWLMFVGFTIYLATRSARAHRAAQSREG